MAMKITASPDDVLEGDPADQRVRFGIGGTGYGIVPSTKSASAFAPTARPSIERGRRAAASRSRVSS
jgi:hypothetical protein